MKKTIKRISVLLVLLLALFAASCGEKNEGGTSAPDAADPSPAVTVPAETDPATAPGTDPAPLTAEEAKAAALLCVEGTVEELYEKIGKPDSSDYAPSCLGPGEDGNLYYDTYGFVVYTYLENNVETVRYVD